MDGQGIGFELQPLADYVLEKIKQGERNLRRRDDPANARSRIRQDAKGLAVGLCARRSPIWRHRCTDGSLIALRTVAAVRHLAGFTGILQVDGYAAYNRLARSAGANEGVTLAACFAHVRRRFYELHVNESSRLSPPWPGCGRSRPTPRPGS